MLARAAAVPFTCALLLAQDPAAKLLATLSLEQKAGQLFMAWSLSRAEGKAGATNHDALRAAVRDAGLGGVILSLGTVDDAAALVPTLQADAKVPLLLAGDFEGGVWFRLSGATELGNQMLVGATGSAALAEAMGRVTGEEAKALGFHVVFAPVLDVNSNPANPIINVRSFGEDPELVSKLGCAFVKGVQSAGLLACGKHFPGHGDVDTDSHLALPTVPGDGAKLRRVELLPFQRAIDAGLDAVMTGHLAVPGLGEAPDVPATLSSKILTGVLRGELGFRGVIVTDALGMGGIENAHPPGEVAVRALLAGADVLLMPPDPLAARAAVVDAVSTGRVPLARLDDAVLRILQCKAKVGLLGAARAEAGAPQRATSTGDVDSSRATALRIASRGVTLVRDRDGVLPLPRDARALLVVLTDSDAASETPFEQAARATMHAERVGRAPAAARVDEVAGMVAAAQTVVLALHVKVREYAGGIGMPAAWRPVLDALTRDQHVVVVSFGNPYLLQHLPLADAYVAAFVDSHVAARHALGGVLGTSAFTGRLPVAIPGVATAGAGLTRLPGTGLDRARAADEDLDAALPDSLRTLLERGVADRAFPGAVCVVARRGNVVAEVAVGQTAYDGGAPVTAATRYDLASLTKVCATTPAVLKLVAAGKLSLDDPVQKWVPAFIGTGKERVTVRHLLAHHAGLPAYERYYRTLSGKDAIVAAAAAEGLMSEPGSGVRYSDLGFVLLGAVVEQAAGEPFAAFVQREVWAPLGVQGATFAPIAAEPLRDAAPTELDERPDGLRRGIVRGFVHDENAFAMGGISGHAGMFGTADDVLRLGVAFLAGGRGVLPRALVDAARAPAGIGGDATRGLGFQLLADGSWGGTNVPAGTFGHTGFTGTSLWCCPRFDLCVALLTNRVHPTRVNGRIAAVRRAVHDAVLQALR